MLRKMATRMNPTPESVRQVFSEIAENRRILAALEWSLPPAENGVCLLVTSALRQEGKSLTAAGLATLAAQQGDRRVIVADLNWYRPTLHRYFNLEQSFDSNRLRTQSATDLLQPSGLDNLAVLTAPLMDAEAAANDTDLGIRTIRHLKETCELLIVDAPSVFPTNRRMMDPVPLAQAADAAIMVVLANVTPRQEVKRACFTIKNSRIPLLGLILNQFKNPIY